MPGAKNVAAVRHALPKYTVRWVEGHHHHSVDCRTQREAHTLMARVNRNRAATAVSCTGLRCPVLRGQFMRYQGSNIIPVGSAGL